MFNILLQLLPNVIFPNKILSPLFLWKKITAFQSVSVLPNWDMFSWLDFFLFFLLLTGREVEGWWGANYKSSIFITVFWSTSGTEEMVTAAFGCGLNYATGCGSLSDHTTPANCTFLPLFSYYSDNPIFSSILIWKVVAWKAEDKIRNLDFSFTEMYLCFFPFLLIKPWKFWVISTISTTGHFTGFFSIQ